MHLERKRPKRSSKGKCFYQCWIIIDDRYITKLVVYGNVISIITHFFCNNFYVEANFRGLKFTKSYVNYLYRRKWSVVYTRESIMVL